MLNFTTHLVLNYVDIDYDTEHKTFVYSIKDIYLNPSLKSVSWATASTNGANLVIINYKILSKANQDPIVQDTVFSLENFDREEYLRKFRDFEEY